MTVCQRAVTQSKSDTFELEATQKFYTTHSELMSSLISRLRINSSLAIALGFHSDGTLSPLRAGESFTPTQPVSIIHK